MCNVRIAITPSGIPHIGNIYILLSNYFLKKKCIGNIILRFDDTNNKKNKNINKTFIKKFFLKFGLKINFIISQSNYLNLYLKYITKLKFKRGILNKLFFNLKIKKKNINCLYFLMTNYFSLYYLDNNYGLFKYKFNYNKILLLKKNTIPTYNYSSYINDYLNNTNIIIRGKDWLNQLQIQIMYNILYNNEIKFHHLHLLINYDGEKFSKSKNNFTFQYKNLYNTFNFKNKNIINNKLSFLFLKKDFKILLLKNKNKINLNKYFFIFFFKNKKYLNNFYINFYLKIKKKIINFIFKNNINLNNYIFKKKNLIDFLNIFLNFKIYKIKYKIYEFIRI